MQKSPGVRLVDSLVRPNVWAGCVQHEENRRCDVVPIILCAVHGMSTRGRYTQEGAGRAREPAPPTAVHKGRRAANRRGY